MIKKLKYFIISKTKIRIFVAFVLMFVTFISVSCYPSVKIPKAQGITISDGFVNPLGFHDSLPTFSWKLPVNKNVKKQLAFSIVVASSPNLLPNNPDLWQSGKINSNQSTYIPYKGIPFASREKVYWQVQYWNQDNQASDWSDIAFFEMGLLKNSNWRGQWIGIKDETPEEKTRYDTPLFVPQYLRKEFELSNKIKKARLYVTAKGIFEAYLNGKRIGDDTMVPGWTPYNKRLETLTYDVTNKLTDGNNAIGFILAEGWYAGRIGYKESQWTNTKPPKVLCQLEIEFNDGQKKTITTDKTWKATQEAALRFSGIYDGEIYDASKEISGWNDIAFNEDKKWQNVVTESISEEVLLKPKRHQPVRKIETLATQSVIKSELGEIIFDIGQNLAGVAHVNVLMKKGDTLKIEYGEILENNSLYKGSYRRAHSTDYYIARESGVVNWYPKFTYHGFRYVKLSGFDSSKTPEKNWVQARVMHSAFKMKGNFSSSNEKLNQLQNNIQWGLKSNFFEVPTDCPQRDERLGFTGDAQVFTRAAIFNADLESFFMAWLESMREEQFDDNTIPVVIPNIIGKYSESGWSDAAVIIPWEVYKSTGNPAVLSENYAMIKRWVTFHQSQSTNYISNMKSVGDWLQPYATAEDPRRGDTPHSLISTAHFGRAAWLLAQIAKVLGNSNDNQKYMRLYDAVAKAFENQFFDNNGKLTIEKETQTAYLLALDFNLLSDNLRSKAAEHLKKLIHKAGNHLRTGFLGTPLLAPVLDKMGYTDVMYTLLLKETYPSWLYSVNQGATTMWERWDSYSHENGFIGKSMNSFNHYAYGAIGQFLYERIAGIYPLEAGYKKIRISPYVGGGLSFAKGEIESPYGKIVSYWKYNDGQFQLKLIIPPNTTATVMLPAGKKSNLIIDGYKESVSQQIVKKINNEEIIELEVQAGNYTFITKPKF